jgi:hypothetical protein
VSDDLARNGVERGDLGGGEQALVPTHNGVVLHATVVSRS